MSCLLLTKLRNASIYFVISKGKDGVPGIQGPEGSVGAPVSYTLILFSYFIFKIVSFSSAVHVHMKKLKYV